MRYQLRYIRILVRPPTGFPACLRCEWKHYPTFPGNAKFAGHRYRTRITAIGFGRPLHHLRSTTWQAEHMPVVDTVTEPSAAPAVAAVAAATFPLACPPHSRPSDIAAFIDAHLNAEAFARHIADPDSDVLVVRDGGAGIIGYSLVHHRPPTDPAVAAVVTARPVAEISKVYVVSAHHGRAADGAAAGALMRAVLDCAGARGAAVAWLGVNQQNLRAQRFYAKCGFDRAGTKNFDLNGHIEHDYVLVRAISG